MTNRRNITAMLGVLTPLVLLLAADFILGDDKLFSLINQGIVNPILDFACVYASPILFSVFYVTVLAALYFSVNSKSTAVGILSVANGVLTYVIGSLIKVLVTKPRPEILAAPRVIGHWNTSTFSFPSTLIMLAFGLTLPILLEKRRAGAVLVALSYFLGFAVVYTGFHFPMDVVSGVVCAFAVTFCTNWFKKPLANCINKYRVKTS